MTVNGLMTLLVIVMWLLFVQLTTNYCCLKGFTLRNELISP